MQIRSSISVYLLTTAVALIAGTAFAAQTTSNYSIPLDVIDAGGSDVSKSSNYLLSDSVGEPIVGYGSTSNYILNSGYRQPSASDFLSMTCSSLVTIGAVAPTGQQTGSGTCTIYTDAYNGYNLMWSVLSGSGGVNTGYLISQYNDTIAPFYASSSGAVAFWKIEETTAGSTVRDYSRNGNSGTPAGATGANNKPQPSTSIPTDVNFRDIRSLDFDGTDDVVTATVNGFGTTNTATMLAWVNIDTFRNYNAILESRTTGLQGLLLSSAVGNPVTFSWEGTADEYNASTNLFLGAGQWYLVAATISPTSATVYRISATGSVASYTINKTYNTKALEASAWSIGQDPGQPSREWDGRIDEVRIYKRTLSLAELKSIAAQAQTWSVASTEAYWGSRISSRSTDTHPRWGIDGASEAWLNIGDGSFSAVRRTSATVQAGSTEIFQFRAEVGSSALQPSGTYRATATYTVVSY